MPLKKITPVIYLVLLCFLFQTCSSDGNSKGKSLAQSMINIVIEDLSTGTIVPSSSQLTTFEKQR